MVCCWRAVQSDDGGKEISGHLCCKLGVPSALPSLPVRVQPRPSPTNALPPPPATSPVPHAARGIVRQHGLRGLYRGLGVTVLEIMPYAALQFGLYDVFSRAYSSARASRARVWGVEGAGRGPLAVAHTAQQGCGRSGMCCGACRAGCPRRPLLRLRQDEQLASPLLRKLHILDP